MLKFPQSNSQFLEFIQFHYTIRIMNDIASLFNSTIAEPEQQQQPSNS